MTKYLDSPEKVKKWIWQALRTMIDKGCNAYCKQYKIGRHPEDIFPNERQSLYDKIYNEEMPAIEKGEY